MSGDCPVFLRSSTVEGAKGAGGWRVTNVRGENAAQGRGWRAAGRRCSRHFGSSDWIDRSVSPPPTSPFTGGRTCAVPWGLDRDPSPESSSGTECRQVGRNEVPPVHPPATTPGLPGCRPMEHPTRARQSPLGAMASRAQVKHHHASLLQTSPLWEKAAGKMPSV